MPARKDVMTKKKLIELRKVDKLYQKEKRLRLKGFKTEEFRIWRTKNPLAYKAQQILNFSIKKGFIKRGKCIVCGKAKAHAHHPDYTKPLEVVWLCSVHHKEEHIKVEKEFTRNNIKQ